MKMLIILLLVGRIHWCDKAYCSKEDNQNMNAL